MPSFKLWTIYFIECYKEAGATWHPSWEKQRRKLHRYCLRTFWSCKTSKARNSEVWDIICLMTSSILCGQLAIPLLTGTSLCLGVFTSKFCWLPQMALGAEPFHFANDSSSTCCAVCWLCVYSSPCVIKQAGRTSAKSLEIVYLLFYLNFLVMFSVCVQERFDTEAEVIIAWRWNRLLGWLA